MLQDQYLARIHKSGFGIAHALATLDKLKEYAEHFGKSF